uniref:K Homology domain-containing protein n=1 Tax=Scylla olivacea TaxID=85551 RepID=A0A0P4WQE0_SCYOL
MTKEKSRKGGPSVGKASSGKADLASRVVATSSTSQVVRVNPHERSLLIGPNGCTLRRLLDTHKVRMSLSRGGRVTVRGHQVRVARAVAHIDTLLRAPRASEHYGPAPYSLASQYFRQGLGAIRKEQHTPDQPPALHVRLTDSRDIWAKPEVLRSLGRQVGFVLRRIFDYMCHPHK